MQSYDGSTAILVSIGFESTAAKLDQLNGWYFGLAELA
jgi:hypothetical protein